MRIIYLYYISMQAKKEGDMAKVSVSDMGKEQIWGTEHIYIIKTIEY